MPLGIKGENKMENENLTRLYNTCMELKAISSTNEKKAFLEANKDDKDFTYLLKFLLNPRIVTGISKAKLSKNVPTVRDFLAGMENLYYYLEQNNTGRDNDIAMCQGFIARFPEYKDFLSSIVTKTLKLGVDVKLCNTVYGKDFIPVHEVQQGSPRNKLRLKKGETFYLTQKLNGVRGTYVDGEIISRQGIPFTGLGHIIEELKIMEQFCGKQMVFDGELIRKNVDNLPDNKNFRIGTGVINSDDADKSCIEFVLFDCLPLKEFRTGESKGLFLERRGILGDLFSHCRYLWENTKLVPIQYAGADENVIDKYLEMADNNGWEGLMLNKDCPYYCKRHTGLIKIKTFLFSDLKVIGYEEGTNKYKGMLGALIVEYKGNPVNVGSGFTDGQREEYWPIRDELVGKIVEVKYKEESSDKKTGLKSIQFPIFNGFRSDKTEESLES